MHPTVDPRQYLEQDPIHLGAQDAGCWVGQGCRLLSQERWEGTSRQLFLCLRLRGKAKQNGKNVLTEREENGLLCVSSIARIEKIKAKQRKVAALQRGSRRPASPVVSVSCLPREVAATGPSAPGELGT